MENFRPGIDAGAEVGAFYQGNLLARGWTQETKSTLAVVTTSDTRRDLTHTTQWWGWMLPGVWPRNPKPQREPI